MLLLCLMKSRRAGHGLLYNSAYYMYIGLHEQVRLLEQRPGMCHCR